MSVSTLQVHLREHEFVRSIAQTEDFPDHLQILEAMQACQTLLTHAKLVQIAATDSNPRRKHK
jgi:hypothetical protein